MDVVQASEVVAKLEKISYADKAGKKELIKKFVDEDPIFAKVLVYALDSSKTFKVSRVPELDDAGIEGDVFEFLDELNSKSAANGNDKSYLAGLANQSYDYLDVVNRILRGRLDAGFDIKTVLEACPGLIDYSPYCRCSDIEKINKVSFERGAVSQIKADGMFLNVHIPDGTNSREITYTTRRGNKLELPKFVDKRFYGFPLSNVAMGEALVLVDPNVEGVFLPRTKGNAIINKAIHDGISDEEAARIRFQLWDLVPATDFENGVCDAPYFDRFEKLRKACSVKGRVELIESFIVESVEEAWEHYIRVRERGLEGTIVKDWSAVWFDGTSPKQIKLKAEKECEVLCIGWKPGKPGGKYAGCIGSLTVRSHCGKLVGDVSGMTDENRLKDPEYFIGQIIGVKFNAVSKSAKTEIRSFDHAGFIEVRTDKKKADTLKQILEAKEVTSKQKLAAKAKKK